MAYGACGCEDTTNHTCTDERIEELKKHVGQRVYFNMRFKTLAGTEVDSGTLVSVDELSVVVRWDNCLCLNAHGAEKECGYTERVSIFVVDVLPPSDPQSYHYLDYAYGA